MKVIVFWDVIPCHLVFFSLKMELTGSSKTLITVYQDRQHHRKE
jgi:hypothetical protein